MKRWQIVYGLPLEVWVDIFAFPWITRKEFGRIVDKIGNFKFAEHAQFYLHEWSKRKLDGELYFEKDGLIKSVNYAPYELRLDVPQTELPANIRSFEQISINHFDANTLDFLDKIRPLLTANALEIHMTRIERAYLRDLRTILTTLAPMLGGIHTLACNELTLPMAKQCFGEEKLARLKVLQYWYKITTIDHDETLRQEHVNSVVDWLAQQNGDNDGPKLCEVELGNYYGFEFLKRISAAIRQQFLTAKTPRTFALNLVTGFDTATVHFAEFHLANSIGEQLHGVWTEIGASDDDGFQITRHQANRGMEQLQEWIRNTEETSHARIHICYPTIGSLNAAQVDEEEQAERQQQPSCSKDA